MKASQTGRVVRVAAAAVAGFACLTAPVVVDADETTVDLRPAFVEGRVTRYAFDSSRTTAVHIEAGEMVHDVETTLTSEGEVTWTVIDVERDGSADVTYVYDWLRIVATRPDGDPLVADSRRGRSEAEPLQALVDAVAGTPLTVTFAADGSVTALSGVEAIRKKTKFPDAVPADRDFLESVTDLLTLPGAPVDAEPGDAWDQRFVWGHQLGDMAYDSTYELVGVEPMADLPIATIRVEARLDLTPTPQDLPPGMPAMRVELESGSLTKEVLFDLTRHEAVGRHETEENVVVSRLTHQGNTMTQRVTQRVSRQALRIGEE